MTECDPCAVNLAENRGVAGYFGHYGGLAETHFPNTLAKIIIPLQHADATAGTGAELAERYGGIRGVGIHAKG